MSAPGRELHPGSTLGPFQVLSRLGRGAMGTVYKARDRAGVEVALKVMNEDEARSPVFVERFRREAMAAIRVDDPHVVRCLGSGEVNGSLYMALELVTGGTLAEELHRRGRYHWRDATRVGVEIARALEAIHAAGLVHRDLKPQNVLIDSAGRAKVADFGIARGVAEADRMTRTGELLGTAEYMAPEQAGAKSELDGRADLYALGTTIHALIGGVAPFRGTVFSVIKRKLTEPAPRLRTLDPQVPPALDALVHELLAPLAEARPRDARSVRVALERIAAAPDGAPAGRRLGLALAVAVVAAVGVALVFRPGRSAPPPAPSPSPTSASVTRPSPSSSPSPSPTPSWYLELAAERRPATLPPAIRFSSGGEPGLYELVKDETVKLVFVPAGEFLMGNEEAIEGQGDACPEHRVQLSSYFIGQTELTIAQLRRFVAEAIRESLSLPPNLAPGLTAPRWDRPFADETYAPDDWPATFVSHDDAIAYCSWAGVALPTEAQWERAGGWDMDAKDDEKKRRFSWGNDPPDHEAKHDYLANLRDMSWSRLTKQGPVFGDYEDGYARLAPVKKLEKDRSPVGCFDMVGNVCEICADYYGATFYKPGLAVDPFNAVPDPSVGEVFTMRGGSWARHNAVLSVQFRWRCEAPCDYTGFRVALTAPKP